MKKFDIEEKLFIAFIYTFFAIVFLVILAALIRFVISIPEIPEKIINNKIYIKYFDKEKYEKIEEEAGYKKAKLSELRRKECAILVQAKKEIMPIKIEKYVLKGYSIEKAQKKVILNFEESEIECKRNGISPYIENFD